MTQRWVWFYIVLSWVVGLTIIATAFVAHKPFLEPVGSAAALAITYFGATRPVWRAYRLAKAKEHALLHNDLR